MTKEEKKAYDAEYYQKNKEACKAYRVEYRKEHKEAQKAYDAKRYEENPEKIKANNLKYYNSRKGWTTYLKNEYGISFEDWGQMLVDQSGRCGFCDQPLLGDNTTHVDHGHLSNQVRRLLCGSCNKAYGLLKENSHTLSQMYSASLSDPH